MIPCSHVTARPKLQQVSSHTGLSPATISRVLNGKPGVAGDTRQRVLDAVADLGYTPRPVRANQATVVAIITPELDNPIFPTLAQAIETRLAHRGMMAVVCPSTSETVNEQDYIDRFVAWGATGVVVINGRYAAPELGFDAYVELRRQGFGVVLVNGLAGKSPVPAVAVDVRAGAAMATRHLHGLGHTQIGVLTGPRRYNSATELLAGYQTEMHRLGLDTPSRSVSESLYTIEGGRAGVARLLEEGVTGVIAGSDPMAVGAIAGARAWGYRVPGDISVIGFDGTPMTAFFDPPLTTVHQPLARMASAVTALIETPETTPDQVHMFQPDLIIGGSSGPVAP